MASRKRKSPTSAPKGQPLFVYLPTKKNPTRVLEIEHMLEGLTRRSVRVRDAEEAMLIIEQLTDEEDTDTEDTRHGRY